MSTRSSKDKIIYEQKVTPRGQHYYTPYYIGKILGKGGFATCYEVKYGDNENKYAIKIIQKQTQHHTKQETIEKVKEQIGFISSLEHPGIVKYIHDFQDSQNCYIILQLCPNGSLSDVLRRRRNLTQPQIRYFILQMIGIMKYIKEKNIIHRDIKLANYFLDQKFRLKLGDFGLATKNDQLFRSKRKMCGTPNYIAPEIIQKKVYGFEVDTWSTGVLIFTLAFGVPPFQTKTCKQTYQRIKRCSYKFEGISKIISCSDDLKDFIKKILCLDPIKRLKIQDFVNHPFISRYIIPQELEVTFPASTPSSSFLKKYSKIIRKKEGCSLKKENSSTKQDISKIEYKGPKVTYKNVLYTQPYIQKNIVKETQYILPLPLKKEQGIVKEYSQNDIYHTPKKVERKEQVKIQGNLKRENEQLEEKIEEGKKLKGRKKFCPNFSFLFEKQTQKKIIKIEKSILKESIKQQNHSQEQKPQSQKQRIIPKQEDALLLPKQNPPTTPQIPLLTAQCEWIRPSIALKLKHPNIKIKPFLQNQVKIIYWLNITQKYGIVYILSNHQIGLYFNDSSRMLLSSSQKTIHYIIKKSQETIHRQIDIQQVKTLPKNDKILNKIEILQYYNKILRQKYPLKSNQVLLDCTSASPSIVPLHLKGFKLGNYVSVFKFSNNDVQFFFQDGEDIMISFGNQLISYRNSGGLIVTDLFDRQKIDFEPEFVKKIQLVFSFYGKWLPKNGFEGLIEAQSKHIKVT